MGSFLINFTFYSFILWLRMRSPSRRSSCDTARLPTTVSPFPENEHQKTTKSYIRLLSWFSHAIRQTLPGPIQVMVYLCPVIIVYGQWGIIERCQQVRPDIPHFAGIPSQTAQHISHVWVFQL